MKYTLPALPYAYDALEPYIDARTMELHHTKHHQTYVNKLNEALDKHPEIADKPLEELLRGLDALPPDIRTAVRNHGGGHANHSFFWTVMGPAAMNHNIDDAVSAALAEVFGSAEKFKEEFTKAATGVFGSGWAWLVRNDSAPSGVEAGPNADQKKLMIITTPNQDSPLMQGLVPLLGLDLWEHGFYLKHGPDRPGYIQDWWNVVNWQQVDKNLNS